MSKSRHTTPCAVFTKPSASDPKTAELYIYGAIPSLDWNTYELINTDREFLDQFKALEKDYDRINIHINSPGGVITDGLVMFNTIKSSKKEIHTYNDGLAASMASVLLLAGDVVHAPASSIIMIHSALGGVIGNKNEIRDYADMLEVYEEAIINAMSAKAGKKAEDIRTQYFDGKDHFMTGEQAAKAGLIDVLEDYSADLPEGVSNMTYDQIVNHYSQHKSDKIMNLIDFFSGKAKAEKNTVEVEAAQLEQLRTASEEAVNKIAGLESEKAALNTQLESLKAEKSTAEASLKTVQDALAAEQAAHKVTSDAFEAFKKEPGATHTSIPKEGDAFQGSGEPESQIRKDEAAARAKGESIAKYNKK